MSGIRDAGRSMNVDRLLSTRGACPEPLLGALETVRGFSIGLAYVFGKKPTPEQIAAFKNRNKKPASD